MLAELKLKTFRDLVKNASKDELIWMNGFISALMPDEIETQPLPKETTISSLNGCTIVYGTETGNSKKVAVEFSNKLKKNGVQSKVKSLDQYRLPDLAKETSLLVVMSTQGDGEPPAAAKKFYDYLLQNELKLNNLQYGVFALGDTAYPLFCKAGEDVDVRLNQLGAKRLIVLKKCDTDFEEDANTWIDEFINTAFNSKNTVAPNVALKNKPAKTGKKLYDGTIVSSINLNDKGSNKETFHIEISTGEAIAYEPGDSIGIIAANNQTAVQKIFELLNLNAEEDLIFKNEPFKATPLFTSKLNIQYLPERIVQQYAKLVNKEIPSVRMDLADLLRIYPAEQNVNAQELISILDPIVPRLYSISSSPSSQGENEVHITVSRTKFNVDGHLRYGLCSDYLSTLTEGDAVQFYVQRNSEFKLPSPDADVIMIGPGTGIAPFRSFLFEREAQSAAGKNWLFFGEQHFVTDFLYQTELQSLLDTGTLTKLSLAFSRDQQHKIYVQHKMEQHADELYNWLENGAHLYLCGCKDPMSVDVEQTLLKIISEKKKISGQSATEYLDTLKEEGRYHKDVY